MPPLAIGGAAIGASLVLYALVGHRRDPDAERRGSHFLLGIGDFLVHWFMWLLSPVERLALALGWAPDVFNFIGLGFGAVSGLCFARGSFGLAAAGILGGGICDILDGRVARRTGTTSAYGAFLDSSLDRFVEAFAFLGLVAFYGDRPPGAFAAASALGGSLLVSYTRARGESVGVLCREGLMQRAERLVLMFLSAVFDRDFAAWSGRPPGTLLLWTTSLIAAGTFATAIYRTWWISVRLRRGAA
jgi:CDP-diacylglycerol---glycerol-3-phosphate 3-phosphatidyltransferase